MQFIDSLRSFVSGLGDPARDKTASLVYMDTLLSDDQLMTAYRNSWIARKIVDIPAMDALRKGRDWQADQDTITLIEEEERRLNLWNKLLECKTKARLFGGAGIVIGTNDVDMSEPFEPESIGKDGLRYLTVITRRDLRVIELDNDPGSEFYGQPKMFSVNNGNSSIVEIHPSRVMVQIGNVHPDPWCGSSVNYGWGDSVLQSVYTAIQNADSTSANIANLVFEANVDSFGIPDMMEQIASDEYRKRLLDRLTLAATAKSVTKSLIHDAEETYSRNQISFGGLNDIMNTFMLLVAGAADIPLTRFLGQSPSGMSTTGEGDMKNYYDRVTAIQSLEFGPAMWRLDEALIRSALGTRPDDVFYMWSPLEQMSEQEQADVGHKNAQSAQILAGTGLWTPDELRKAVSNQLVENGIYPGLGEIMAETNLEPDFGMVDPNEPKQDPNADFEE